MLSNYALTVVTGEIAVVSPDAVVVTAERLNIRSEATADSRAVTVVSAGETLKYVCEADDWRLEPDGEDEAEARAEDSDRADGGWEVRAEADGAAAGA